MDMRVLILSTVRTRSSFFIDTVSKYYNLENLYEYYGHLDFEVLGKTFYKKEEILWNKLKEITLEKTKLIDSKDNYAIKVHPNNFINVFKYHHNYGYKGSWNMNDKDDIMPLSYLKLDSYDKIYYLTRNNFTDLYCSWMHGMSREKLLYTEEDKALMNVHRSTMNINLDERIAKILLFDLIILDKLYEKFQKQNKDIIKLDYEETVPYTQKMFTGIESKYVDTKFDYKSLVKNYDQLSDQLNNVKEQLVKEINWDLFSE